MGRLAGIARHDRPKGPMQTLDRGQIRSGEGVVGDFRGALKPGRNRREVTVMAVDDWSAALRDIGRTDLDWWDRRANLLVDGLSLPRTAGSRLRVGGSVVLEVTGETEPCERMEELAPGLRAALTPHWRGGVTTRVIESGPIAVGDSVEIEE